MGKDGSKLKDLIVGDLIHLARSRGGVWLVELACEDIFRDSRAPGLCLMDSQQPHCWEEVVLVREVCLGGITLELCLVPCLPVSSSAPWHCEFSCSVSRPFFGVWTDPCEP